jgi:hypothetical protein
MQENLKTIRACTDKVVNENQPEIILKFVTWNLRYFTGVNDCFASPGNHSMLLQATATRNSQLPTSPQGYGKCPITTVASRSAELAVVEVRPLAAKASAARGAWRSLVSISR